MSSNNEILAVAKKARKASYILAQLSSKERSAAVGAMAVSINKNRTYIKSANAGDIRKARDKGLKASLIDRLILSDKRIDAMIDSLNEVENLDDSIGDLVEMRRRPNGLVIGKMKVPIGVIGIIYESRPNVTSDCAGLCIKSGNCAILKGGSEAIDSNKAILRCLKEALRDTVVPQDCLHLITQGGRAAVSRLLGLTDYVDLIIPRGGEGLIREVVKRSRIPVIKHYKGVCHVYVDSEADLNMAHKIVINAKVQRPGVCNAMETLLVHKDVAWRFLPVVFNELRSHGVEIRGCAKTRKIARYVKKAVEKDWSEEYLGLILSVKIVDSLKEAIDHINKYGTRHSDAIVTESYDNALKFLKNIDSACVYLNASTRFTDGYEFGMGAEIGISTDKLHARGPMALEELTTYKYVVLGKGQIRT
ncbi:MAG: glutamate-5-semialdehyde dehydrogenase [Candidatus Omnitrophica bacterium]|nr:glutamate-5-semialdehyde dehydrogenase [Candidatus Omnitrophota bacterium]